MKKQFLALAALALTFQLANAQTEKGKQTLGLNLGLTTNDVTNVQPASPASASQTQTNKYNNFSIGPNYSYFIADNLDLGASLAYGHSKYENSSSAAGNKQINDGYSGDIYLRKYVLYNNKLGFRTGARAGYGHATGKYTYNTGSTLLTNTESKTNNYDAGLMFDLVYYPSTKLGITASIASASYIHSKTDNGTDGTSTNNSFNLNFINNGVGISVFYVFGGK